MPLNLKISGKVADGIYSVSGQFVNREDPDDVRDCSLLIERQEDDSAVIIIREDLKKSVIGGEQVNSVSQKYPFSPGGYRIGTKFEVEDFIPFNIGKPISKPIYRKQELK